MLTEEQISELEELSEEYDVVGEVLKEYKSLHDNPAGEYYQALVGAMQKLTEKIRNETIDIDNPYEKSVIRLLESGAKVYSTIKHGMSEAGLENNEEIKPQDFRTKR